jgi:hypothetical protein
MDLKGQQHSTTFNNDFPLFPPLSLIKPSPLSLQPWVFKVSETIRGVAWRVYDLRFFGGHPGTLQLCPVHSAESATPNEGRASLGMEKGRVIAR